MLIMELSSIFNYTIEFDNILIPTDVLIGINFSSIMNNTKNTQIWEIGHQNRGYTSTSVSMSSIISGDRTS